MPSSLTDWLELLEFRHPTSIDLGLDRVREVWHRMGSPKPANRIFTIAGTNGKGSTVSYLCGMLHELGCSYGSYTTPHLLRYNERIQIGGVPCRDDEIVLAFEEIEAARGEISLTYFEFGTLAAIAVMAGKSLDFAVMEVGLGGRLDAVNILDPDCAVITPIGLDHQEFLGPDRESIGAEKAGIIRDSVPVICGEPEPPASVVGAVADKSAPLYRLGREFSVLVRGRIVTFEIGNQRFELPLPAMRGQHQVNNMATAVAALLVSFPESPSIGESLSAGLQRVRVPGRLQQLSYSPLVLVDVGHNPLAAEAVAAAIREASSIRPGGRCRCVFAMLKDKDAAEVAVVLNPVVDEWFCAGLEGDRGQTGIELSRHILASATPRVKVCPDVTSAFAQAMEESSANDCVLVFGSFLTAAAALEYWSSAEPPMMAS